MITREKFDFITEKYGHLSSWAVWAEQGDTPTSNMGDLSVLDPDKNSRLLKQLNPNVVLVALNFSAGSVNTLANFHGVNGTVYKLRYAVKNTDLWGAYITDIIKEYDQKESGKVEAYLRAHPEVVAKNVETFRDELKDLGSKPPILIALGKIVYEILKKHLGDEFEIIEVPHYAYRKNNKEKYREKVKTIWESR